MEPLTFGLDEIWAVIWDTVDGPLCWPAIEQDNEPWYAQHN